MSLEVRQPRTRQARLLPDDVGGWMIAVEGPIGVGKTTLARRLAAHVGAELLLEVVEENPFLQTFYQDIRGLAFRTQLFFLLSRHRQLRAVASRLAVGGCVVADYVFAKDRLFATLTLDDAEQALYDAVYDLVAPQVPQPVVVVYLRASVPALLQRIAARGRAFERDLTADYLARLSAAYDELFAEYEHAPVVTVDTDGLDLQDEVGVAAVVQAVGAARRGEHLVAATNSRGGPAAT
jgi:deoxyadenosine/deoxycytidine kinase